MPDVFEDEVNPFQEDQPSSSLGTPRPEHVSFTPERSSSAATVQTVSSKQDESTDDDQDDVNTRPLPATPTPQTRTQLAPGTYRNEIDRFLQTNEDAEILIAEAVKTTDNSSTPYIVYVIRTNNLDARRRYSDFESFRNGMVKLYPTLIVPPIPSKQTIGDYAVKANRAKEDVNMIARRKRMLQVFLNRVARHPVLSRETIFHRFLSPDVSWVEILHSPPLSQLPKNMLRVPANDPLDDSSAAAYYALSSPSTTAVLRVPDQRFIDSETFTARFATHLSGSMEKVSRRTAKRLAEYAHDYSDLGAAMNGFSLSEPGHLAAGLEKTGQAFDATYISTTRLLQDLEQTWTEPLGEYAQFSEIIKKLLQYRHQKHAQYENTQDTLDSKRLALEELENSEKESRRLEDALAAAGVTKNGLVRRNTADSDGAEDAEGDGSGDDQAEPSSLPPAPVAALQRRNKGVGTGLLSALSHSIHGMMDVDPEAARRSNISKIKDFISQLEEAQRLSASDLKYASSTIQADLDRFQRQKVADLREMALAMARIHRDWCKANLEAWEAARASIQEIEPHPNASASRS